MSSALRREKAPRPAREARKAQGLEENQRAISPTDDYQRPPRIMPPRLPIMGP